MNTELKEACEVIGKFMNRTPFTRYLISKDKGESLVMEFTTDREASGYLSEQHLKGWMKDYGVVPVKSIYYKYATSLDSLVPVWEKLKILNPETEFLMFPTSQGFSFKINSLSDNRDENNNWIEFIQYEDGDSYQEAACLATAEAIRELTNER